MIAILVRRVALTLLVGVVPISATALAQHEDAGRQPFIVVLGIAQDGGSPPAGCRKTCCAAARGDPAKKRHVSCLGIIDPQTHQRWLIEATPDFPEQLRMLDQIEPPTGTPGLTGILLTHGHIGHYSGLMFLGHEAIGAKNVPVYAMKRMRSFLSSNGPWDQLVRYGNIKLHTLTADTPVKLNDRITVTPFRVPHREEYTEVVGFRIDGPNRAVAFIPDIDKWERWQRPIEQLIADVDVAYLDGTFYADGELGSRDMTVIPHPFIAESIKRFAPLPAEQRAKIRFIHLNHTNPALNPTSSARRTIEEAGFTVASERERTPL